jgi:hypothetical protein
MSAHTVRGFNCETGLAGDGAQMPDARPVQLDDAVSLKNGQDAARQQMLDVCRKALPGWEQLAIADVQASPLL